MAYNSKNLRSARKEVKTSLDKEVGSRIKKVRTSLGISREKLADQLGLGVSHMGLIERGERGVTLRICRNICDVLSISSDYLVYGKDHLPERLNGDDCDNPVAMATALLSGDEQQRLAQIIHEFSNVRRDPRDGEILLENMRFQLK